MSEPNDVQELIREIGDLAEAIRLILVPHLDEPERRAFWNAVKIRDLARSPTLAALSARIEGQRLALDLIASHAGKTLISVEHGQPYSIGANAAFEDMAAIAREALSPIPAEPR